MRSQNLTIAKFAHVLRVSEPTLKRWLVGKGVLLVDWQRMLEALGLSIIDVAARSVELRTKQFEYTAAQEDSLARTPGLLAFFQKLQSGKSVMKIAQVHKLSKKSLAFYLRELDRIKLIEWSEGWTAKLKEKCEPRWRKDGALAKAFRAKVYRELIEHKRDTLRIGIYELSAADREKIRELERELFIFAQEAERRCRILGSSTASTGMSFIMDSYSPVFLSEIPNI